MSDINDFKLLAIRPLKGCDKKFSKVLNEGEIYKFYNDYEFYDNEGKEIKEDNLNLEKGVAKIEHSPTIPEDLYDIKNEDGSPRIKVNISAVVGKNGSGKSSLIELLYAAMYVISIKEKILKKPRNKEKKKEYIELISSFKIEIYYSFNKSIYRINIGYLKGLESNIDFSIVITDNIIDDRTRKEHRLNNKKLLFDINNFFYTITINYSLYSLNANSIGDWINSLFHKNDGYQTPIVINPKRDNGNIDINEENDLVKQRLISNILQPVENDKKIENSLRNLAIGKNATKLILELDHQKIEGYKKNNKLVNITNSEECFAKLYYKYTGVSIYNIAQEPELNYAVFYSKYKIIKICEKYKRYHRYLDGNKFVNINDFIKKICEDSSHVTFKIKQTLNFIRYQHVKNVKPYKEFEVEIQDLSLVIKDIVNDQLKNNKHLKTIELIPPSIFKIKIKFDNCGDFEDFSSGEKQKIHSISSIIYHIININSIFINGENSEEKKLIKYKNINVVFDEVELYFHPDLQRTYIRDLLNYIKKMVTTQQQN